MSWRTTLGLKPGRNEFADEVIRLLRQAGVGGKIAYDPAGFRLKIAALSAEHFLDNHYAEVCRAWPWQRGAVSQQFIRSLLESRRVAPEGLDDVRQRLLPTIRDPLYADSLRLTCLKQGTPPPDIPSQAVGGFYAVSIGVDSDASIRPVNADDLQRWSLTFDQAMAIAVHNLAPGLASPMRRIIPGLFRSEWQDNYDPSRILLPALIDGLDIQGEPVAIMPHRDCLLIADTAVDAALARLAELGRAEFDNPRRISAVPIIRHGGAWRPFLDGSGGPGATALAELGLLGRNQAYADQKEHLDAVHDLTGKDVFVATFTGYQVDRNVPVQSFCTWSRDAETLLPRTDLIALNDGQRPESEQLRGLFRWDDVARIASDRFHPVGLIPERWLTAGFPSDEQIAQMTRVG